MKKGRGRTSRIRRRKLCRSSPSRGVNESYKPEFIALKKWLKARKFEDTNLIPACFPDTGRGLMSKTSLQEGQVIISLPESCLLTTDTVIRSYLGAYIAKWQPPPSPLLALCTFLVAEKHAGDRSPWKPYLEVLPKAYTCPVCLEPEVVALLPRPLEAKARQQRTCVRELFTSSRGFFSSLQPLLSEAAASVFSYRAFLWAWCTVNTRAVYMKRGRRQGLSAEPDTCALAPYLDLLNHSPAVQVKAAFNEETRCYEIRTGSGCRRHEEVFICYGPHDSRRLLLEYGFVPRGNPHACVPVSQDVLVKYLPSTDKQMNKKISILKDHDFIENLTFGWDGPSWRLLTALKLLCLEAGEFPRWKKVLLGERISDTNEKTSLDVAQKICRYFTEEASAMLQKVSHMKDKEMTLIHQLTLVETLWTEELKILWASAETLSDLGSGFILFTAFPRLLLTFRTRGRVSEQKYHSKEAKSCCLETLDIVEAQDDAVFPSGRRTSCFHFSQLNVPKGHSDRGCGRQEREYCQSPPVILKCSSPSCVQVNPKLKCTSPRLSRPVPRERQNTRCSALGAQHSVHVPASCENKPHWPFTRAGLVSEEQSRVGLSSELETLPSSSTGWRERTAEPEGWLLKSRQLCSGGSGIWTKQSDSVLLGQNAGVPALLGALASLGENRQLHSSSGRRGLARCGAQR